MITPSLPLGIEFHADGAFLSLTVTRLRSTSRNGPGNRSGSCRHSGAGLFSPSPAPSSPFLIFGLSWPKPLRQDVVRVSDGKSLTASVVLHSTSSIRYIGFSLTYSIAVGLSSILGHKSFHPSSADKLQQSSASRSAWVLAGIAAGALGLRSAALRPAEGARPRCGRRRTR